MPQFRNNRRVKHSACDMFDLVADVERYPDFVPLCESLKVRRRVKSGEGIEIVTAQMTVAFALLRETFVSRVTLDRPRLLISVAYLDGPFSRLDNRWTFTDAGAQASDVEFFIDYEFKSRMLGMVMGSVFDAAFRRFAEAFERRADAVYANRQTAKA
jgi:coenzyme Q-binding protein COQ10